MFTGIVEELGHVLRMPPAGHAGRLAIQARTVLEGTRIGDSIAVNGVCLTVVSMGDSSFEADVMPETLRASGLGRLTQGSPVNLERAVQVGGRLGGHIVSGHIDGTGRIVEMRRESNAVWVRIATNPQVMELIVERGSIAVDGISLTVARVGRTDFSVSVIPHTGQETSLLGRRVGDTVNLENDVVGKYVRRLLAAGHVPGEDAPDDPKGRAAGAPPEQTSGEGLTLEFLRANGF